MGVTHSLISKRYTTHDQKLLHMYQYTRDYLQYRHYETKQEIGRQ